MSGLPFPRSVVFLSTFITAIGVGSAQRQNTSEPLASPAPLSSRRAALTRAGQAGEVPRLPFDPRQPLHEPVASTLQTNVVSAPMATATPATGMSLSANTIFVEAPVFSSGGYTARSVAVADVNGDGKPDLLVVNQCSTSSCANSNGVVGVLLGNGDGTFQAAVTYASGGANAYSVAVADVNGDGKPDLLVSNQCVDNNCANGSVGVLLGNGDGTFQSAASYGSGGEFAYSVAAADVNGDGKPDLLVANQCATSNCTNPNGTVGVLMGNGDGTFQPAVMYASGGVNTNSVAVADVNGDGKPDLVISNQCADSNCANGTVGVLLGNGNGTFRPVVTYASAAILLLPWRWQM